MTTLEVRDVNGVTIEKYAIDPDTGIITDKDGNRITLDDLVAGPNAEAASDDEVEMCHECGGVRPATGARVEALERTIMLVNASTFAHDQAAQAAEIAMSGASENVVTGIIYCLSNALADGLKHGAITDESLRTFLTELLGLNEGATCQHGQTSADEPETSGDNA